MLHRVALRDFCIQAKEGLEISGESQTGPVLVVECIVQERVVLKDIFKIFIVEMQILFPLWIIWQVGSQAFTGQAFHRHIKRKTMKLTR
jgi:hypothetical protein